MTNPANTIVFTTSFDVDQISAKLNWNSSGGSRPPTGRHSGSVYFEQGDTVALVVVGGGSQILNPGGLPPIKSFEIVDFCVITQPEIVECGPNTITKYANPSPFSNYLAACHPMSLEFTNTQVSKNHYLEITKNWIAPPDRPLTIGKQNGRWEISMYITVKIFREGLLEPIYRVFFFDPEGEVGTGLMNPGE